MKSPGLFVVSKNLKVHIYSESECFYAWVFISLVLITEVNEFLSFILAVGCINVSVRLGPFVTLFNMFKYLYFLV